LKREAAVASNHTLLLLAYEEGRELVLEPERKRSTVRRHAELLEGRGQRGVLSTKELALILRKEKILGTPKTLPQSAVTFCDTNLSLHLFNTNKACSGTASYR
jgi:hypothetical protein